MKARDSYGLTPLETAIKCNHASKVAWLLGDPEQNNSEQCTTTPHTPTSSPSGRPSYDPLYQEDWSHFTLDVDELMVQVASEMDADDLLAPDELLEANELPMNR